MKRYALAAVAALFVAGTQLHAQAATKQDTSEEEARRCGDDGEARRRAGRGQAGCLSAGRHDQAEEEARQHAQGGREGHDQGGQHGRGGAEEEVGSGEEGLDHQEAVTQAARRFPQLLQYRASGATTGAPHVAHLSFRYLPQFEQ